MKSNLEDGLSNLQFKEGNNEGNNFIKFVTGQAIKVRVFTTNPTIHINNYGKEQISFAVWNIDEAKPMILSKGPSIARQISGIHVDDDFGADITKVDIKILPTGDGMNREYAVNVLPKATELTDEQLEALAELDKNLSKIFKGSVRAEEYNNGVKPTSFHPDDGEPLDEETISQIPFN